MLSPNIDKDINNLTSSTPLHKSITNQRNTTVFGTFNADESKQLVDEVQETMTNIKIQKSGGSILLDNYQENPSPKYKPNSKILENIQLQLQNQNQNHPETNGSENISINN